MERPLTTLIFVISGFAFSALSLLVESQTQDGANPTLSPPVPSPPPPSPLPPPPLPPPPPPIFSPPPSFTPPPFSPPPPFPTPPPPRRRRRSSPPPSHPSSAEGRKKRPPGPYNKTSTNQGSKRSLNNGKKVGLFFVGIAAVLQICVVAFLVFKRRQLLRVKDRYEGFS